MKILVTGGAGFIGSHIVERYLSAGHEVGVLDDLSAGSRENVPWDARFYRGDVVDAGFVERVMSGFQPEIVSHHAARISVTESLHDPATDAQNNIVGGLNVLQAAIECGASRFIFASSAAIYGEPQYLPMDENHPAFPTSPYGLGKLAFEHYLRIYREQITPVILRYANVYEMSGAGQGAASVFWRKLQKGDECVIYGDGTMTRDYVHVEDVAEANLRALECTGGTFNIATGVETSTLQLFESVCHACQTPAARPALAPQRDGEVLRSVLDNARAASILDWEPSHRL